MNKEMLLQQNWSRVIITPDIKKDPESWNRYIRNEVQPDLSYFFSILSYEDWSDRVYENETVDLYIFQPHSMLLDQFIEEYLDDEFYWKYEIKNGEQSLTNPFSDYEEDNYYYENEYNEIIKIDDELVNLIFKK